MNRLISVLKFGGTSLSTPEARAQSAQRVIAAKEAGFAPVVVVSAVGRIGAPYATDTLINSLKEVDPALKPEPRELDLLMACGEILSAVIFSQTLASLGHPARSLRGDQAGIKTDGVYGNARIVSIQPTAIQLALDEGFIPVVCGFQGAAPLPEDVPAGDLTTLGRGGSDTTAAALGVALKAHSVHIFTDVDGVKTADPDFVPSAPTLPQVSYEEVAEIAHLGAKVLHPRAAEIAMKSSIPLYVRNTFSSAPGTEVVTGEQMNGRRITGVTHSGKLTYLEFDLSAASEPDRRLLQTRVCEMLARYGVQLYMMNLSLTSLGFAIPTEQYSIAEDLLDGLVAPIGDPSILYLLQIGFGPSREVETQAELLKQLGTVRYIPIGLTESCTIVSLVGYDFLQQATVYFETMSALHEQSIPVLQASDSDFSLSCLIPEADSRRAVSTLHERFGLASAV